MRTEACWPCRERKVRCDTRSKTVPCPRCIENNRAAECWVPPRQKRRITKRRCRRLSEHRLPSPSQLDHSDTIQVGGQTRDTLSSSPQFADHLEETNNEIPGQQMIESCFTADNEDSILSHVCEQIASGPSPKGIASRPHLCSEAIEYQNPLNAAGILGEVLANHRRSSRVIQINYAYQGLSAQGMNNTVPQTRRELELQGLDEHDIAFLNAKGALQLPPNDVCDDFLAVYFNFAYPYAPILDRCELLAQYQRRDHSLFVMQALLANAVPYASSELIARAGFGDRESALKSFYKRAVLLYDFNCEKNQLYLLQGSLLLGVHWVSHVTDKDYRYWISTAIRIAMRMGLHRKHIEEDVEPNFYKLLKRIWCVIWIRDVLMITTGLDNGRRVPDDCDTLELTEDDWAEDESIVPLNLSHLLPRIPPCQKQFSIQLAKLAIIGRAAHAKVLSHQPTDVNPAHAHEVLQSIISWRLALPAELRLEAVECWLTQGVWTLVLLTWCSRIECHIHRTLWQHDYQSGGDTTASSQRLRNAVLDLDTIVKRAVLHNLCRYMPLSIATSAASNVALAIEILVDPQLSAGEKLVGEDAIRNGIAFLSEIQDTWTTVRALLRLFAWVFARKGLQIAQGSDVLDRLTFQAVSSGDGRQDTNMWPDRTDRHADAGGIDPALFTLDRFADFEELLRAM